jgi:hemerythrin superfamily protein
LLHRSADRWRQELSVSDDDLYLFIPATSIRRKERNDMARTKTKEKSQDAVALLKADHDKVRELLDELEQTADKDGASATELMETIQQELKVHTQIEEEIFYPAFRDAASKKEDSKLYYEAVEEHHVVDMVLPEIDTSASGSPEFAAKAKVLKDLVEHHAEEEEKEMFPKAKKLLDKDELVSLGERMAQRKSELSGGNGHGKAGEMGDEDDEC